MNHKFITTLLAVSITTFCCAQLVLDKHIQLSGPNDMARQVMGLTPSSAPENANTAVKEQSGELYYVNDVQGNNWQIVTPSLDVTLQPGTHFMLNPPASSIGPITINVGNEGPFALEWKQGVAVLGQDIPSGMIISAVFDGTVFQVLNGKTHRYYDCLEGMVAGGHHFCIDTVQHMQTDFFQAALACAAENKRLCTWGESMVACFNTPQLGILTPNLDYEWVDDTANELLNVRVFRYSVCTGASHRNATTMAPFRCCYTR